VFCVADSVEKYQEQFSFLRDSRFLQDLENDSVDSEQTNDTVSTLRPMTVSTRTSSRKNCERFVKPPSGPHLSVPRRYFRLTFYQRRHVLKRKRNRKLQFYEKHCKFFTKKIRIIGAPTFNFADKFFQDRVLAQNFAF